MSRFIERSEMPVSADALFAWHARPGAFERLIPPWEHLELVRREGDGLDPGAQVELRLKQGPVRFTWVAEHTACEPGRSFRDEQIKGPFSRWRHTHRFLPIDEGHSTLEDDVEYALPLGRLGHAVADAGVRQRLARTFGFRHARTRDDLRRHALAGDRRLRIAITGASGLIGRTLVPFLTTGGHEVLRLVRREARATDEIAWQPETGDLDADRLEGLDAVIHLCGENLADGRWTDARKARIRDSRVESTRLLARTLAALERRPAVLVSMSATGFYGDRPGELVDEGADAGQGFLAEVCSAWEAAAAPAADVGIRVVHPRLGVVLSPRGGALARLLPVVRAGVGGRVGPGRQPMSWIALDDAIGALHFLLFSDLAGPVNVVAPDPVTNAELVAALASALDRPAWIPLPAAAVRLAFGEMGEALLLQGARVQPRRLLTAGFEFLAPDLEAALAHELGRSP